MAEEDEFEKQEYGDTEEGTIADEGGQDLLKTAYCEVGDCPNTAEDPAEPAWVKLMSAVPTEGQTRGMTTKRTDIALPGDQEIGAIVDSIRPANADDYSMEQISGNWTEFRNALAEMPADLENGLSTLAEDWKGDDYDAFEEQVTTVVKNIRTVIQDIGDSDTTGIIGILSEKQQSVLEQQGGQAIVYPAPKFWLENTGCGSQRIHVRPPFFDHCEIYADDETKHALELAGFESDIYDEVQEGKQETYDYWYEYYTQDYYQEHPEELPEGKTAEELATEAAQEYADTQLDYMGNDGSEQYQAKAAEANEEVTTNSSNASTEVSDIQPESTPSEQTTFNDGQTDLDSSGGLDSGGATSSTPDVGSTSASSMDTPTSDTSSLSTTPSSSTGSADTSGLDTSTSDLETDDTDDTDWSSSGTDDEETSGGLASATGGSSGLGSTGSTGSAGGSSGLGSGSGSGSGSLGSSGVSGMVGSGSGARGASSGSTSSRGSSGRGGASGSSSGRSSGTSGMMGTGGGRGMGGKGEGEQETDTWLTEEDDVWGIGNENTDPYA